MSLETTICRFVASLVRPVQQWSAIESHDPQDRVAVLLNAGGSTFDVTANNTVASLKPLTLVIGTPPELFPGPVSTAKLLFWDTRLKRELGSLRLKSVPVHLEQTPGIQFLEVEAGHHVCLGRLYSTLNAWFRRCPERWHKDPQNFTMAPGAADQLMIFYICPRQVVLVSVKQGTEGNIFPMDLIGPLAGGWFSLGLRNTSASVGLITRSRQVALSSIRASDRPIAYKLGAHHKNPHVSWADLPFEVATSSEFSLPVPKNALRVRELLVDQFAVIGSHTFFLGRIASDRRFSNEPQLFHTAGFHQHFQKRRGVPFPEA